MARRLSQAPQMRGRIARQGEATRALLEFLAAHEVSATFFQCGMNVHRHPRIAREVAAAGHEIGNHTFCHPRLCPRFGRKPNILSPAQICAPGVHSIQGPQRLIQAISMAGGVRNEAGSRVIITREARWGLLPLPTAVMDSRGTFSTATISLQDLLSSKFPDDNIFVDPGDVISIPKADVVYVLGTVKKAGGFPLEEKDSISLLQTLSLAEGFDHDASPSKVRILRPAAAGEDKVKEIPVNISRIMGGKDPDVQMYPNDVLYVPSSTVSLTAKRSAEPRWHWQADSQFTARIQGVS